MGLNHKSLRILVAEDDPTTQMLCHEMLEELGHVCLVSPDGGHALTAMTTQANDFDVLLSDYMMPVMDGSELIRRVREHRHLQNKPIIIMSAVISTKEISHLLHSGATYFLPKPFAMDQLQEYLGYCQKQATRDSASPVVMSLA